MTQRKMKPALYMITANKGSAMPIKFAVTSYELALDATSALRKAGYAADHDSVGATIFKSVEEIVECAKFWCRE